MGLFTKKKKETEKIVDTPTEETPMSTTENQPASIEENTTVKQKILEAFEKDDPQIITPDHVIGMSDVEFRLLVLNLLFTIYKKLRN